VWQRFGDVPNYVEPFAGSLAVLLGRPTAPRVETVNDLDCYLANFWRAVQADPGSVAHFADWPVNEADLHARHRWLVNQEEFRERMKTDPEFFDAKIAGWWVWGICQWIGSGWCTQPDWTGRTNAGRRARGVAALKQQIPFLNRPGSGVHRKRPVLSHGGNRGVVRGEPRGQKPLLRGDSGAAGAGIHASGLARKRPSLTMKGGTRGDRPGSHVQGFDAVHEWMLALQDRLRRVRVCCGDWRRVLGRSATECIGVTAVFLDPPYGTDAGRDPSLYAHDDLDVAAAVREWAVANGSNPKLRIALCGYEGEHEMPDTWECVAWKANGGYASSAGNHENSHRERIWFSPACLKPDQPRLF
jgi:site-specific DNA-adenine methylase